MHSRLHTNENKVGLKRHWRVIIVIGLRLFVAMCPLSGPNRHIQMTVSLVMDIHFYPEKNRVQKCFPPKRQKHSRQRKPFRNDQKVAETWWPIALASGLPTPGTVMQTLCHFWQERKLRTGLGMADSLCALYSNFACLPVCISVVLEFREWNIDKFLPYNNNYEALLSI